jgi:coenzyme F420-reducing hydrogenase beta subunit
MSKTPNTTFVGIELLPLLLSKLLDHGVVDCGVVADDGEDSVANPPTADTPDEEISKMEAGMTSRTPEHVEMLKCLKVSENT